MIKKKNGKTSSSSEASGNISTSVEELLLAAQERGGDSFETGRYLITFKEGAVAEGIQALGLDGLGMRVADAREFSDQAAILEHAGDADAIVLPEIGVAVVSAGAANQREMSAAMEFAADSPMGIIEPEYFVFSQAAWPLDFLREGDRVDNEYLRGFLRATETIARDLRGGGGPAGSDIEEDVLVSGATWGVAACRVNTSPASGAGIKIAVLDTGMDLGHPDFAGRPVTSKEFVGQAVQDLHSHGTHCIGTACGPIAPVGSTPRYGIAHRSSIFAGKVLSNSGSSVSGSVLAGMNWAVANRCEVISMSLGSQSGISAAYTAAGQAALNNGLLMIAAAGNAGSATGAPANSPTIMSVAWLTPTLQTSPFSNFGKIDIAGPGQDVFSSVPRPTRYGVKSGTSMATPHVAGCAALWAQTSPSLRGLNLWRKLQSTARRLPLPVSRVGAGLVQAPQ